MMVGLYYVIQEMGIFPMSVANNFCDMPLPKYLDSKTVLIYRPHPVHISNVSLKQHAISVLNCVERLSWALDQRRQRVRVMLRGSFTAMRVNCINPSHTVAIVSETAYRLHTTIAYPTRPPLE
jgi:hypothetical protein